MLGVAAFSLSPLGVVLFLPSLPSWRVPLLLISVSHPSSLGWCCSWGSALDFSFRIVFPIVSSLCFFRVVFVFVFPVFFSQKIFSFSVFPFLFFMFFTVFPFSSTFFFLKKEKLVDARAMHLPKSRPLRNFASSAYWDPSLPKEARSGLFDKLRWSLKGPCLCLTIHATLHLYILDIIDSVDTHQCAHSPFTVVKKGVLRVGHRYTAKHGGGALLNPRVLVELW